MNDSLSSQQLKELYDQDEPGNRLWFKHIVDTYVEAANALSLKSLPIDEQLLLERLLIDLVEAWVDREGIMPESDPFVHQTDDLGGLLKRCAKYFMANPYLDSHLLMEQLAPYKRETNPSRDQCIDYRQPGNADFKVQPRYPRLSSWPIPPSEMPILYACYCGAQGEGLAHYLKSQNLKTPYIQYVELLNLIKGCASFYVQKRVLNFVGEKTGWFSGKRNIQREANLAEVALINRIIKRPALLPLAVMRGNWRLIFRNFIGGLWSVIPMFVAAICASLDLTGGTVFFSLWFLGNLLTRIYLRQHELDEALVIYNNFMNNLYQPNGYQAWIPRSVFEIKRVVHQLLDAGEKLPNDAELLLGDLTDEEFVTYHVEHIGDPFDGETLRLSLLRKLTGASNIADSFSDKYTPYTPRVDN